MIRFIRRLVWGRTWAESLALAEAEARARRERLLARADANGCFIVLAPEIEGSYCEIHRRPILPGERDTDHLAADSCNQRAKRPADPGIFAGQSGADDGNRTR